MLSLLNYKAWLIDLDGTLYRAPWVRLAMVCELSLGHWRVIHLLRTFRHEHERLRQAHPEAMTDSAYATQLERTAERLGMNPSEVETIVTRWMIERPGKWLWAFRRRRLLRDIADYKGRGGKTALVSDYPAQVKLQALRASALFDVVIANGESGGPTRLKPAPDGYLLAAKRLGVAPDECLVIGDRADADGLAAKRAQMDFHRLSWL